MMCSDTFQKVVQLRHFVEPASYYIMHLAYFGCGHLILTFSYDLQASITIWPFLYNTLAILHGCAVWLQYFVSSVEAAIFQSHGCAYLHAVSLWKRIPRDTTQKVMLCTTARDCLLRQLLFQSWGKTHGHWVLSPKLKLPNSSDGRSSIEEIR